MTRPSLLPLVPAYRVALALRELRLRRGWEPTRRLRWPVISVGNLSTGGTGKTPFTIALARLLTAHDFRVDVLSRGYGRKTTQPARVLPDGTAEEFGDEPLLIARKTGLPVYVAPQRYDAGLLAEHSAETSSVSGHDFSRAASAAQGMRALAPEPTRIHLLDDAFQHRQLHRDIDILLLNRADLHDHLLPAGILREPLRALHRAHVIAIPADEPHFDSDLRALGFTGPVWRVHRRMDVPHVSGPVAAFSGIARPAQFFAGLEAAGLPLASRTAFRDHHRYTDRDVGRLISAARAAQSAALLTTEKDQVRLGHLASAFPPELPLMTAKLRIEIDDEPTALEWLMARLLRAQAGLSL